jgi:ribose transport system substrate-binding protein
MRLITALLTLLLFSSAVTAEPSPVVIAFAQDTMHNDFRRAQVMEARDAAARHPDVRFLYSDAKGQTSLLIHQIQKHIDDKVDALILGTNDESAVVPVVSKAHAAGVKVIVLDRGVKTDNYTTFINSDNIAIGALGARDIAQRLNGKGLVLLMEGIQSADVTQLRSKGFLDVMANYPDIRIIKRTGNYLRKDALLEMEKLVAEGIVPDAIFSESDSMLSGVRAVLDRHKIDPGSIIMIGCDYTSEARDAIRNGSQTGSILFPLGGDEAVYYALQAINGNTPPHHVVIPSDTLVTRDNVETVEPIF